MPLALTDPSGRAALPTPVSPLGLTGRTVSSERMRSRRQRDHAGTRADSKQPSTTLDGPADSIRACERLTCLYKYASPPCAANMRFCRV